MSNSESTAINELIDLVQRKPLDRDSDEDLLFEAPRAARLARGTTAPPMFEAAPAPPVVPTTHAAASLFPVELPSEPTEARATMPVISTRKQVFEPTPRNDDSLATMYVPRHEPLDQMLKKLALPLVGLLVAGVAIGGVVALARHHRAEAHVEAPAVAAANPIAAPAPAPLPVIVAAKPALVAIRLDSTPSGASATLVDNGASTPLGTTPVDAAVDPSKSYDVVFSLEGRITKIEHFDPNATNHVEVALVEPTIAPPAPAPAPVVAAAPARHHHHAAPKQQAARVAAITPSHSPTPQRVASSAKPAAAATGNGSLMISTNPPCAILIDGHNTGLTSPQAAIALPPGSHQVRLIAAAAHINKLVAIEIVPHHTTKVVQTFVK